jgi:hypothetical protein
MERILEENPGNAQLISQTHPNGGIIAILEDSHGEIADGWADTLWLALQQLEENAKEWLAEQSESQLIGT